jgi:hypothetical protein
MDSRPDPRPEAPDVPPELEESFQSLLDGPPADHEAAVAALCVRHPEHAAVLWRWLAVVRGMTRDADRPALPAVLLGQPERLGPYPARAAWAPCSAPCTSRLGGRWRSGHRRPGARGGAGGTR